MDAIIAIPDDHKSRPLQGRRAPSPRALVLTGVLAGAALLTVFVILRSGMQFRLGELGPFVLLAAAMGAVARYCRFRGLDPRAADAAAIVGLATLALLLCGLISNVGLRLGAPTIDAALARADALVGWDVARAVPAFAAHGWLIDGLAFIYNQSGPLVVAVIVLALMRGQSEKAWELVTTVVIAMQATAAISIVAPARGAMAHFDLLHLQGNGLPLGAGVYHLGAFDHFHAGSDPRFGLADMSGLVTFPSFHTVLGLLLVQALAHTRLRLAGLAMGAATIVSTIPIGGHYVTDILAGCLVWLLAALAARRVSSPSG